MTAVRIFEPSGSDGSIQFIGNYDFVGFDELKFITGSSTLSVTGSSEGAYPVIAVGKDYTGTTDVGSAIGSGNDATGLTVDYNVTGIVASGQTAYHDAIAVHYNQDAPTHVGTVNATGADIRMTGGTSGTQTMKGVSVVLAGADTNIGIDVQVPDGDTHFIARSSANLSDSFQISVTTDAATTMRTLGGGDGDLTLDIDGKIMIEALAGDEVVVNESGADVDLRVESNSNTHMLFVDSGKNKVGVNSSSPGHTLSVTGSIGASLGLSGSLTKLLDGTSYIEAGTNVTVTSASNGKITISSSGGGGDVTVSQAGGSSVSSVTTLNFTGSTVSDDGGGTVTITPTIGAAEDGSYSDGLFTTFTYETEIGIAVDRFNEVLKALAPNPAPDLDNINSLETGTEVLLSFGASNDQSSATPPYVSVGSSAGIGAAVDVNGTYTVVTSSGNIRLGAFDGDTHVSGVLNSDIISNSQGNSVQNYPAFSFGDADTGVLRLNVNGSTLKEIDLTSDLIGSGTSGLGTGSYVDASGTGFNFFSTATTGTLSNGNSFSSFKHRTGKFVVASGSQRNGWNYARVLHVKTGSTVETNYIEWVNDDNEDALSAADESLGFVGSGSLSLSGVKYFRSGTAEYKVNVSNSYKYVYDSNNITFSTANNAPLSSSVSFSISAQSKPSINTGAGETQTKVLHLTGSSQISADYFISGSLTASVNVTSPLKSNLSDGGSSNTTGILMYNLSNTSTALVETFLREDYRIISGAYSTQASLIDASNTWDSDVFMTSSNGGHSNGLQFYNSSLYSPTSTLNSGDFRDTADGGTLDNAPDDNPNYSGISDQRTFYRWFKNETGSTQYDFSLAINGSGTIVGSGTSLNTARLRVFVKFPTNGTRETGWLDISSDFVLDSYSDNDGALASFNGEVSFDSSLNATNNVTLGTVGIANNEYVGIRIEADEAWTGYVSQITVSFGPGTGTITPVPDLDDIDCNDDGDDSNLSFGSSKSITGYTDVGTTAGFSATDVNGLYKTATSGNNLRRSVFALDTTIEGDLNEDVSSNTPSYVANSFSDANSGSLKLEVNGSVIHTVELTGAYNLVGSGNPGSGTGTSVNSNGSGFVSFSTWAPSEYSNSIPYYLETYRTGKYRVVTADQRNGWNYVRVVHTIDDTDTETNYVEWVNDDNSNALSAAGLVLQPFEDDNLFYLSGVKYFIEPSGSIESRISNVYKNVYSDDNSAISFTSLTNASAIKIIQSGSGLSSTKSTSSSTDTLQTLNTNTDSQDEDLHATGSIQFSLSKSLSGSYTTVYNCAGAMRFKHPLKSNLTTSTVTATALQVYSASDDANSTTAEYFNGEKYRVQSGSYSSQASVTAVGNVWSSTSSMNDSGTYPAYNTGLMIYDSYLVSPFDGGNIGDFRNNTDGGSLESPSSNVNYSSLNIAMREYYRSFRNLTTNDRPSITLTLSGSATLVSKSGANSGSLGANKNIYVEIKVPGKSGFLDMGKDSDGAGNISDGDGCLSGNLNANIPTTGSQRTCTFNGLTVDGTISTAGEYFVIKVSADQDWTGYLDQIDVAWSA